jgi:hypothetical protein
MRRHASERVRCAERSAGPALRLCGGGSASSTAQRSSALACAAVRARRAFHAAAAQAAAPVAKAVTCARADASGAAPLASPAPATRPCDSVIQLRCDEAAHSGGGWAVSRRNPLQPPSAAPRRSDSRAPRGPRAARSRTCNRGPGGTGVAARREGARFHSARPRPCLWSLAGTLRRSPSCGPRRQQARRGARATPRVSASSDGSTGCAAWCAARLRPGGSRTAAPSSLAASGQARRAHCVRGAQSARLLSL